MIKDALAPDVTSLLRAHAVEGTEAPVTHNGFSGARISTIDSGGQRFWLKRLRFADDWIMQALEDTSCREAEFAVSPIARRLPESIATPTLGASHDGDGWAILARDVASTLLPQDGIESAATCDRLLGAVCDLHAAFWDDPMTDASVSFSPWRPRLAILEPGAYARNPVAPDFGVAAGWEAFARLAPQAVSRLVEGLLRDPAPLLAVLERLPRTLLHSDAKIANVGVERNCVWMFDWATVMHAPVAFEIGYLIAVNSSRFPWRHDETLDRYAALLERALGPRRYARVEWPTQAALAAIIGLLFLGWAKAAEATAGDRAEFDWWCERVLDAADFLRL